MHLIGMDMEIPYLFTKEKNNYLTFSLQWKMIYVSYITKVSVIYIIQVNAADRMDSLFSSLPLHQ